MRLSIHHTTTYHYSEPAIRVVQAFRLWPAPVAGQTARHWRVKVQDRLLRATCTDGFGNPAATHVVDESVESIHIEVDGEVETRDTQGVLRDSLEPLPSAFFLVPTPLTAADDELSKLARSTPEGDGDIARIHLLCQAVRERIDYRPDQTDATTSAIEALASGAGVCQDHAHVLIACARVLGYPARYVSGYLSAEGSDGDAASHAWVEVHMEDLGWVGFDPANRICPDERYVRVAVGRDYHDAAPVRGLRQGGIAERLEVKVHIDKAQAPQ